MDLGRSISSNTASVCAALDHCHVPGRTGDWQIPAGRVEIGLGLHNETVREATHHQSTSQNLIFLPFPESRPHPTGLDGRLDLHTDPK